MNEKRKDVVHYLTHDTDFRHKHLESTSDKENMEKLVNERDGLPDFFKAQIKFTLDGFEKAILFRIKMLIYKGFSNIFDIGV